MGAQRPESLVLLKEQWKFPRIAFQEILKTIKSIKLFTYYIMFKLK